MWPFDDIRCICLAERDDRYVNAKGVLDSVGCPVRFFRPQRSPHGCAFGCYQSHYICVKEAYEAGKQSLLIFEDDIKFNAGWEQVRAELFPVVAAN
jgi:hypothetical protein